MDAQQVGGGSPRTDEQVNRIPAVIDKRLAELSKGTQSKNIWEEGVWVSQQHYVLSAK